MSNELNQINLRSFMEIIRCIPYLMIQKCQSQDLESVFVSNSPQSIMQARIRNHCCVNPRSVCIYRNIGELWLLPACVNLGSL